MRARATAASARLGVARAQAANADVVVESSALGAGGTRATFATPVGRLEIESPLVGDYNVANLALAVGMAIARGLPADAIVRRRRRCRASRVGWSGSPTIAACCAWSTTRTRPTGSSARSRRCGG